MFASVPPRLKISTKSFLYGAPLLPPPPKTWLITTGGFGPGVGEGVGVGGGVGVGVGEGVGVGLTLAEPSMPPARAESVAVPDAWAVTLTVVPSAGATVILCVSLEDQMKRTPETSVSTPLLLVKARAPKSSRPPTSSVAAAGVTSTRASRGEPKGVPSARRPGE